MINYVVYCPSVLLFGHKAKALHLLKGPMIYNLGVANQAMVKGPVDPERHEGRPSMCLVFHKSLSKKHTYYTQLSAQ